MPLFDNNCFFGVFFAASRLALCYQAVLLLYPAAGHLSRISTNPAALKRTC